MRDRTGKRARLAGRDFDKHKVNELPEEVKAEPVVAEVEATETPAETK